MYFPELSISLQIFIGFTVLIGLVLIGFIFIRALARLIGRVLANWLFGKGNPRS